MNPSILRFCLAESFLALQCRLSTRVEWGPFTASLFFLYLSAGSFELEVLEGHSLLGPSLMHCWSMR